jgi:TM2 domain-containing membrane protein YozV
MGASISQINYWQDTKNSKPDKDVTPDGGDKAIYLSYNVFLCLSVLGGFFGLDHLYLRSPLTFIAKLITNIFTFGTWWLYDATQAIFNRDVVRIFGLGVPGLGPKGIAAGVLANDVPDKKHMAFFVYALALFAGGIFGLDSFLTGDKYSGYIRIMCLMTFIFAPVAILWWLYKVAMFLFKTSDVIKQNSEYFGAPYTGISVSSAFSFINILFAPLFAIKDTLFGTISTVTGPITSAVCTAKSVADKAVTTVKTVAKETAAVGSAVGKLASAADNLKFNPANAQQMIPGIPKAMQVAMPVAMPVAMQPQLPMIPAGIPKAMQVSGGGLVNDSSILPYMVIGTFGLIAVSGFILTYRRLRQNGKQHKTDDPPTPSESRILRESDKKESTKAT